MIKYIPVLFVLLISDSCSDGRSACIDDLIDEFITTNQDRAFTFISKFDLDEETYYIFDNGTAFDAIATVYNSKCVAVCNYRGFRANNPNPCDRYQEGLNRAEQIWPE